MLILFRRCNFISTARINPRAITCLNTFRLFASASLNEDRSSHCKNHPDDLSFPPLVPQDQSPLSSTEIKVFDSDTWELSSGLAFMSKSYSYRHQTNSFCRDEFNDEVCNNRSEFNNELDIDEIEDMRIRDSLFYKIDRGSKEFEEYQFDYHGRKPRYDKGPEKNEPPSNNTNSVEEQVSRVIKENYIVCSSDDNNPVKKQRKPTFNQVSGPYLEPFCLDVYISKQSVRACIVHRVSSKVVAVAHSISKDMKSDLGSTRNASACAAVGRVLAQRALADDIHDVVFTPRKGEKVEGKLQVVLDSIRDSGINLKVKMKQRNAKRAVVYNMP
ncbi:uncharacterized protein [Phyllobates terribilis]|uniref:uncharacterized protein n=1 Tax=Phyllobates terribilis TaxID=111132 RepID=UPI003CCB36CB